MNQARLLAAGDDFDGRSERRARARNKLALIRRVAHRAGSHRADPRDIELAAGLCDARQHARNVLDRLPADAAVAEDAGAEPRHHALDRQLARRLAPKNLGRDHTRRVAADVNRGVTGHGRSAGFRIQETGDGRQKTEDGMVNGLATDR